MFEQFNRIHLESRELPLAESRCPETELLHQYWMDTRGTRFAPAWQDISLIALPPALVPKIIVVDVIPEPLDFVYRFFGTWHVQCHSRDMTGLSVTDYEDPIFSQTVYDEYAKTYHRREPVLFQLENILNHVQYLSEMLRLPLSSDSETIDGIMVLETRINDNA